MPAILDRFPFPFSTPEGQALRQSLAEQFPSPGQARRVAQDAGFNVGNIFFEQAAVLVWQDVLQEGANAGLNRKLVEAVVAQLPASSPRRLLLQRLLQDQPAPIQAEPRAQDGAPAFLVGDDDVARPEALLFQDDLSLPIGQMPGLLRALERLLTFAPAVCRLEVTLAGGGIQYGTGFRIGERHLLTNWHVLHDRAGARAGVVTAEFGYDTDATGTALQATPVACEVASIVTSREDDWAVIAAGQPLLPAWPRLSLAEAAVPTEDTAAFIIQHPQGTRKRIGFVRNRVTRVDDRVVQYLTDTQQGSSGSPVFDLEGRLIALHHAGGRPQEVLGLPPVKKNEGIRISRIVDGLKTRNTPIP